MGWFRKRDGRGEGTVVVDLRDREPAPRWGSPVPCPECGGRGYLDHIDPFKDVMFLHCTVCLERYTVAKADLDALTGT
jgi:hypothetical protein